MDKLDTAASEKKTHTSYVRGSSTINVDTAAVTIAEGATTRQDYVTRRWALFNSSDERAPLDAVDMGAISRLPLPLQVSFRLKMLSIFALQLLVVWVVVGVFRYQLDAKAFAYRFFDPPAARLVIAFAAGLALLVGLYFARDRFPWNWLLLCVFTAAQSFCFVGLGVVLDTNIGFFNCAFSFVCVVLMIALSGVRRRKHSGSSDEGELLSSFAAGAIAYVVVALVACGLFAAFGNEFVTDVGFGATLGFQLLLILWFAYDASSMYRIMSPDEYMHGVIYFYTDLIILAIVTAAVVGTIAMLIALARDKDDDDRNGDSNDSCDADGCSSTAESCCVLIDSCDNCGHHDSSYHGYSSHRSRHDHSNCYPPRGESIPLIDRGSPPALPNDQRCPKCTKNKLYEKHEKPCPECTDDEQCPKHATTCTCAQEGDSLV